MVKNTMPLNKNFATDFASLYPSMITNHALDESLLASIRSHERKRIIDAVLADLESIERGIKAND